MLMKKLLLAAIAMAFAVGAYAQEQTDIRKGYVGITLGPAFPTGDVEGSMVSGAQMTLVNFGYLLSPHIGIAAKWFGNAFVSNEDSNIGIGVGGLVTGPLFSFATTDRKVEFDLIPMIGFGAGNEKVYGLSYTTCTSAVFGMAAAARWNCGGRISLSVGVDFLSTSPENVDLSAVGVVFGVNYRLK